MGRFLLFFLLAACMHAGYAQTWEVGAFAGASGYMGDINPVKPYKLSGPAIGGQVKYNFDGYWSLKLNGTYGRVRAKDSESDDPFQRQRNLDFHSSLTEGSFQVEFNFFNYKPGTNEGRKITPYLFAGIGVVGFEPKTWYQDTEYRLHEFNTEGQGIQNVYKKYALTVPYGAGVKYNIASSWTIGGQVGYRTAFTDYIDDVSGNYADKAFFTDPVGAALSDRSGERTGVYTGAAGTQRGDYRKRDTYMFVGISLTFTFVPLKCASF